MGPGGMALELPAIGPGENSGLHHPSFYNRSVFESDLREEQWRNLAAGTHAERIKAEAAYPEVEAAQLRAVGLRGR